MVQKEIITNMNFWTLLLILHDLIINLLISLFIAEISTDIILPSKLYDSLWSDQEVLCLCNYIMLLYAEE